MKKHLDRTICEITYLLSILCWYCIMYALLIYRGFFPFFQDPDLQRLQKENAHLKEQLTKSMLVLVSSGKINVGSVDRGDIVMVVWNEDHNNFSIYTEPCFDLPLHFLHNESTHLLGLTIPPNNASKRYVLFHMKTRFKSLVFKLKQSLLAYSTMS